MYDGFKNTYFFYKDSMKIILDPSKIKINKKPLKKA
jgi:hypothetical protein